MQKASITTMWTQVEILGYAAVQRFVLLILYISPFSQSTACYVHRRQSISWPTRHMCVLNAQHKASCHPKEYRRNCEAFCLFIWAYHLLSTESMQKECIFSCNSMYIITSRKCSRSYSLLKNVHVITF